MQIRPDLLRRMLMDLANAFPAPGKKFYSSARKYASKDEVSAHLRYLEGHGLVHSGRVTYSMMGQPWFTVDLNQICITAKGIDLAFGISDPVGRILGEDSEGASALRSALKLRIQLSGLDLARKTELASRLDAIPHLRLVELATALAEIAAAESPKTMAVLQNFLHPAKEK